MAASIPTTEPLSARAGDTWQWRRDDLADYPASDWTLTYYFRSASAHFDVVAAPDGDLYAVSVDKATTAALKAGDYDWLAVVDSLTERFEIGTGRFTLLPDFSAATNLDARSFARKMLDAIEASLQSRATSDELDLIQAQFDQRQMQRDRDGLLRLRGIFQAEVQREENPGSRGGRILVNFSRA